MKNFALLLLIVFCTGSLQSQQLTVRGNNFDTTTCGTKKCKKVFFKNETAATQTLESVGVLGPLFTLEDINYNPPYVLNAGDSVGIQFCHTAATAGNTDAEDITLQLTGVAVQQKVTLSSKVVAPRMALGQSSIDFGSIINGTAKTVSIVITNQGDAALTIPNASGVAPPFYFTRGPGIVIQPGQSDTVDFLYVPTAEGTQTGTAVFGALLCQTNLSVTLRGTALRAPVPTIGGVLAINPLVVNFDTTLCGTRKRLNVEFRNIGSGNITIRSIVNPPATPFSGTVSTNGIATGATSTFDVFYEPTAVPSVDSQTVRLRADTRQSLSIGMLFDVSGSMSSPISSADKTQRLRAAKDAGKLFVSQLITDNQRNVIDEAQVMSFSAPASTFKVSSPFTTNRAQTIIDIDALTLGASTCLYESIIRAVDNIKTRPQPVLVLLSDGGDGGCDVTRALQDALNAITSNNIRVYVVGITAPTDALAGVLQQIATAGGGTASFARTQQELTDAFIDISTKLSQNILVEFKLKGTSVAPLLTLNPPLTRFDSVKVGDTKCLPVTITNSGTAPQTFNAAQFSGLQSQFSIRDLPVAALLPNASATMTLCFSPTGLRTQSTSGQFAYSTCRSIVPVNAEGIGYDSVVIVMDTIETNVRIGDTVRIPVRLRNRIPASYLLDSMSITLGYNSSVLNSLGATTLGTLSSVFTNQNSVSNFSDLDGTTTMTLKGGTLVNTVVDARLSLFNFGILRGNALSSTVNILRAQMADGNPKVGIVQPATVQLDPICFLAQRLINPLKRIGQIKVLSLNTSLSSSTINVHYAMEEEGNVTLRVFDQLGRQVQRMDLGRITRGEHESALELSSAPSGLFFLRAEAEGDADTMMFQTR